MLKGRGFVMKKFLFLLIAAFCLCFDANAVVMSSSKALSYRNVAKAKKTVAPRVDVSTTTYNESYTQPQVTVQKVIHHHENIDVDLTEKYSADVSLAKGDSAIVKLKDDPCCRWKVKYDSSLLIFTNKGPSQGFYTFVFKQVKDKQNSEVYFDSIKKEGDSIEMTKALFVKGK